MLKSKEKTALTKSPFILGATLCSPAVFDQLVFLYLREANIFGCEDISSDIEFFNC